MTYTVAPHADHGIFGPDSVTWKVYRFPTSVSVGFQRTALTEMLDPFVVASVDDSGSLRDRPAVRYDRTLQYTGTLVFGGSAAAVEAADTLMRIHTHVRGVEPLSGTPYDPNDPAGQLWIHLTQWHSVLYVYEKFGPGPLSPQEDEQYWAECRIAAAFQTIDPDTVPRNRAEMRAYYDRVRPELAASPAAIEHVRIILDTANTVFSAAPGRLRVLRPALDLLARKATIATLPRWMRAQLGIRQGAVTDVVVTALLRPMFRIAARRPQIMTEMLRTVSPLAYPVIAPVALDVSPLNSETVPVDEAWRRAGRPTPREQYLSSQVDREAVAAR
ncbi:oxygenase MpaB family protein [Aeromicrobium sp. A1-2]|uniref:oxygenase MpaB family protein n=1 Tax=Aeromicrobium sp. A1-2 TaxID=2107713 RepID=UPI0013C34718|nr:oxygenase MpaB family protein [Aeromicrobium sp. A1-2]